MNTSPANACPAVRLWAALAGEQHHVVGFVERPWLVVTGNALCKRLGQVPAFGQPVTYRLRVATDSAFTELSLDTTLSATEVQLDAALAPGQRLRFELEATSADSTTLLIRPQADYVVPEWATLLTFNDQAGVTTRERRPTFTWISPEVTSPPGPFTYDWAVLRVDNGLAADRLCL